MKKPDPKALFGNGPGGVKPSITSATLRPFARHVGLSEGAARKAIGEIAGDKVEVTDPTEPFVVIVSDHRAVVESRAVACALCGASCWAAEAYGPLATYLCMECARRGNLDALVPTGS